MPLRGRGLGRAAHTPPPPPPFPGQQGACTTPLSPPPLRTYALACLSRAATCWRTIQRAHTAPGKGTCCQVRCRTGRLLAVVVAGLPSAAGSFKGIYCTVQQSRMPLQQHHTRATPWTGCSQPGGQEQQPAPQQRRPRAPASTPSRQDYPVTRHPASRHGSAVNTHTPPCAACTTRSRDAAPNPAPCTHPAGGHHAAPAPAALNDVSTRSR